MCTWQDEVHAHALDIMDVTEEALAVPEQRQAVRQHVLEVCPASALQRARRWRFGAQADPSLTNLPEQQPGSAGRPAAAQAVRQHVLQVCLPKLWSAPEHKVLVVEDTRRRIANAL
jgi:hypothetical protein